MASNDDLTKASTEAATSFIESFTNALQTNRTAITSFFETIPNPPPSDGTSIPDILWNGNQYPDGAAVQKLFQDDMPTFLLHDVHSIDCQVLNPKFTGDSSIRSDKNFSILITTSGHLRLEDRKTGPLKDFSESFVLVPNLEKAVPTGPAAAGGSAGGKSIGAAKRRDWVIRMWNFRYVVNHHPDVVEGQVAMDME